MHTVYGDRYSPRHAHGIGRRLRKGYTVGIAVCSWTNTLDMYTRSHAHRRNVRRRYFALKIVHYPGLYISLYKVQSKVIFIINIEKKGIVCARIKSQCGIRFFLLRSFVCDLHLIYIEIVRKEYKLLYKLI